MKTHIRKAWYANHYFWEIEMGKLLVIGNRVYTRRRDAVRGLNRFLQRVRAK